MKKQLSFFIDSNVLIDYILSKGVLEKTKPKATPKNFPLYRTIKPSVDFIDIYFKNRRKVKFVTSFLNLCEIPNVLIDKVVLRKMFIKDIALNYKDNYKRKFLKNKEFSEEVSEILEDYHKFLEENEIWFIDQITFPEDGIYDIEKLTLKFHLPVIDAILLLIAVGDKKEYFVTRDKHFLDYKKEFKETYNIKIITPQQGLDILRKRFG